VEQVSARQLESHASTSEQIDRLAVQTLSDLTIAEQRLRPRLHAKRPLRASRQRSLRQTPDRRARRVGLAAARRGLHQLRQRPQRNKQLIAFAGTLSGCQGGLVAT